LSELQTEIEIKPTIDASMLEASLGKLWERARLVSDLVMRLKEENKSLRDQTSRLELETGELRSSEQRLREQLDEISAQLRSQIESSQRELMQLKHELIHAQTNGSEIFSKEEKEALRARMKELIVQINSRL
jgi:predicted RNase H-like nuclease (RuvC/YqgF family)